MQNTISIRCLSRFLNVRADALWATLVSYEAFPFSPFLTVLFLPFTTLAQNNGVEEILCTVIEIVEEGMRDSAGVQQPFKSSSLKRRGGSEEKKIEVRHGETFTIGT